MDQTTESKPWEQEWNSAASVKADVADTSPQAALNQFSVQPWDSNYGGKRDLTALTKSVNDTYNQSNPPATQASSPDFDSVFQRLISAESGGRQFDASGNILTSSKGAKGITQVLDKTGADPGFGVTPIQDNSQAEYLRFGRDYLSALTKNFGGDTEKAVAAYNAGPGKIQSLVNKYGDQWLSAAPAETKKYVKRILG